MLTVRLSVTRQSSFPSPLSLNFPPSTTLWDVLAAFESKHDGLRLTGWTGVPEAEKHALFEITYNVPSKMQPVVRVLRGDEGEEVVVELGDDGAIQEAVLSEFVGEEQSIVRLVVRHEYTKPKMSDDESKAVLDRFHRQFSTASHLSEEEMFEIGKIMLESQARDRQRQKAKQQQQQPQRQQEDRKAKKEERKLMIRKRRKPKIFLAPPARRLHPSMFVDEDEDEENDEQFYTATQEEVMQYAKSIEQQKNDADDVKITDTLQQAESTVATEEKNKKENEKKKKKVQVCLIRVRLPNLVILQARFGAGEKIRAIREFVRDSIEPAAFQGADVSLDDIQLFVTPPKTVLQDNDTLRSRRLVPAAIVHAHLPELVPVEQNDDDADVDDEAKRANRTRFVRSELAAAAVELQ